MTSQKTEKPKTCCDCLKHERVGLRGCSCASKLHRCHSQLYCDKLGRRAQDAKGCVGYQEVPQYDE